MEFHLNCNIFNKHSNLDRNTVEGGIFPVKLSNISNHNINNDNNTYDDNNNHSND